MTGELSAGQRPWLDLHGDTLLLVGIQGRAPIGWSSPEGIGRTS